MADARVEGEVDLETGKFERGVGKVLGGADKMGASFKDLKGEILGGLSIVGVIAFARSAIEAAAETDALSARAGVATDEFQTMGLIVKQTGGEVSQLGTFLAKLRVQQERAAGGNEAVRDTLQDLGVSMDDITNATGGAFVQAVADAYNETRNLDALVRLTSEENAPKMERTLISLAENGLGALTKAAVESGLALDTKLNKELADAQEHLDALQQRAQIFSGRITGEFLKGLDFIEDSVKSVGDIWEILFGDDQNAAVHKFLNRMSGKLRETEKTAKDLGAALSSLAPDEDVLAQNKAAAAEAEKAAKEQERLVAVLLTKEQRRQKLLFEMLTTEQQLARIKEKLAGLDPDAAGDESARLDIQIEILEATKLQARLEAQVARDREAANAKQKEQVDTLSRSYSALKEIGGAGSSVLDALIAQNKGAGGGFKDPDYSGPGGATGAHYERLGRIAQLLEEQKELDQEQVDLLGRRPGGTTF